MRWQYGITDSMGTNLSKLWEMVVDKETRHAAVHGINLGSSKDRTNLLKIITDYKERGRDGSEKGFYSALLKQEKTLDGFIVY